MCKRTFSFNVQTMNQQHNQGHSQERTRPGIWSLGYFFAEMLEVFCSPVLTKWRMFRTNVHRKPNSQRLLSPPGAAQSAKVAELSCRSALTRDPINFHTGCQYPSQSVKPGLQFRNNYLVVPTIWQESKFVCTTEETTFAPVK